MTRAGGFDVVALLNANTILMRLFVQEDRLKFVEAKLLEVLSNQSATSTPRNPPRQVSFSPAATIAAPPQVPGTPSSARQQLPPSR